MKKLIVNQYSSVYSINEQYCVVDFLTNQIKYFLKQDNEIVFQRNEKYEELDLKLMKTVNRLRQPAVDFTIALGFSCNLRCVYCYERKLIETECKSTHIRVSAESIAEFISEIARNKKLDSVRICFTGGEPFLKSNMKYLKQIASSIKSKCGPDKNVVFSAVTNGVNVVKFIDEIMDIGINKLQITLDGMEQVHNRRRKSCDINVNGFKNIVSGIDIALNSGIDILLRVNVDMYNMDSISDLYDYIIMKKWNENNRFYSYLYPITASGNTKYKLMASELELFDKVLNVLEDKKPLIFAFGFHGIDYIDSLIYGRTPMIRNRYCGVANGQYVVVDDGKIYSCWWGVGEETFRIGDLNLLNKLNLDKIEKFSKRDSLLIDECRDCKFKYLCGAGCAYKAWKNNENAMSPNCSSFDAMFERYLIFLEKKEAYN